MHVIYTPCLLRVLFFPYTNGKQGKSMTSVGAKHSFYSSLWI